MNFSNIIKKLKKTISLAYIHKHISGAIIESFGKSQSLFAQSPWNFLDMAFNSICVKKKKKKMQTRKQKNMP